MHLFTQVSGLCESQTQAWKNRAIRKFEGILKWSLFSNWFPAISCLLKLVLQVVCGDKSCKAAQVFVQLSCPALSLYQAVGVGKQCGHGTKVHCATQRELCTQNGKESMQWSTPVTLWSALPFSMIIEPPLWLISQLQWGAVSSVTWSLIAQTYFHTNIPAWPGFSSAL